MTRGEPPFPLGADFALIPTLSPSGAKAWFWRRLEAQRTLLATRCHPTVLVVGSLQSTDGPKSPLGGLAPRFNAALEVSLTRGGALQLHDAVQTDHAESV